MRRQRVRVGNPSPKKQRSRSALIRRVINQVPLERTVVVLVVKISSSPQLPADISFVQMGATCDPVLSDTCAMSALMLSKLGEDSHRDATGIPRAQVPGRISLPTIRQLRLDGISVNNSAIFDVKRIPRIDRMKQGLDLGACKNPACRGSLDSSVEGGRPHEILRRKLIYPFHSVFGTILYSNPQFFCHRF